MINAKNACSDSMKPLLNILANKFSKCTWYYLVYLSGGDTLIYTIKKSSARGHWINLNLLIYTGVLIVNNYEILNGKLMTNDFYLPCSDVVSLLCADVDERPTYIEPWRDKMSIWFSTKLLPIDH